MRSFENLSVKENSALGLHFTSELDCRVERVSEVNKIGNFLH